MIFLRKNEEELCTTKYTALTKNRTKSTCNYNCHNLENIRFKIRYVVYSNRYTSLIK